MASAAEPIAEWRRTQDLSGVLGLILFLACFTVVSTFLTRQLPAAGLSTQAKARVYGTTFAFEWVCVGYVIWRLRRLGLTVRGLIRLPSTLREWLVDIGVTMGFFAVWVGIAQGLEHLLRPGTPSFVAMLPSNKVEIGMWIVLSLTAGFAEELVFRGYLQKALEASSNSVLAIIGQGIVFGTAHSYQGIKLVTIIIVLGSMLGFLAHWRHKLWPGMMFHGITDILGVVLR